MKIRTAIATTVAMLISAAFACQGFAQQGVAEKVGQRIDGVGRGIKREAEVVGEGVRKRFDTVKADVGKMGVASRVYSRIHWERSLHTSKVEVHMLRGGIVLLRGHVPDTAAKTRAVAIAMDTEGVTEVVDELIPMTTAVIVVPATPVR